MNDSHSNDANDSRGGLDGNGLWYRSPGALLIGLLVAGALIALLISGCGSSEPTDEPAAAVALSLIHI